MLALASLWQSAQALPVTLALFFHKASPSSTHSMPGFEVSSFWIAFVSGVMKLKPDLRSACGISVAARAETKPVAISSAAIVLARANLIRL
jgi:hypothetical protein